MELVAIFVVGALFALAWVFAVSRLRARARDRRLRREKLDGLVEGHLEMADAHAGSLEELRPQALAHRQAAADHTREAEELERRIELQERHARFHEERAAATHRERERV
jgi:hypothetical protein